MMAVLFHCLMIEAKLRGKKISFYFWKKKKKKKENHKSQVTLDNTVL